MTWGGRVVGHASSYVEWLDRLGFVKSAGSTNEPAASSCRSSRPCRVVLGPKKATQPITALRGPALVRGPSVLGGL